MRSGEIYVNGIKAGILKEESGKGFMFQYYPAYLENKDSKPASLTLPLREQPYHSEYLFPAFANMLSEGENRRIQARLFHIDPEDDFGIMLETCCFDTIGALTIKPLKK